jgi:L-lactate dehydrogenase
MKKVLVIGAGNVGAHVIHYGITRNIGAEFFLLDVNEELEQAQILDLKDTLLFSQHSQIQGINFGDSKIAEMDVIIITAGANQAPGETRCDLLNKNAKILQNIANQLKPIKSSAVVLLITNPVDILTHLAYGIFDLPQKQIFGTGTLLDSARLRWRIADQSQINIKNVHGHVLGEHGDSEFVAWSTVHPSNQLAAKEKIAIEKSVKEEAYDIIAGKGATYFGISAAATKLLNAILHDTREILPVSTVYPHTDHPALSGTPIGIPAVIGANGIERVPELHLGKEEIAKLETSAEKLHELYGSCPVK